MHITLPNRGLKSLVMRTATVLAALLFTAAQAQVKNADNPEASPNWQKVKASLFKGRSIAAAPAGMLELETPQRAADAAVVPVAMRTQLAAGDSRYVKRLTLVIDSNPSVVAAVFDFAPGNGNAEIETRVRIDEYTHVRAIAELSDGQLFMSTRYVKASGGCSAPAGKDPAEALASLGKMRLRVDGELRPGQPMLAQLMINHPNHSGMAMDQLTRQFTPAHFVRQVNVSYAGKPVMSAELDFSISENPNLRFRFVPRGPGELKVEVLDSQERRFESALVLAPAAS
jgi:sulfur-oxidizing protein SoxY